MYRSRTIPSHPAASVLALAALVALAPACGREPSAAQPTPAKAAAPARVPVVGVAPVEVRSVPRIVDATGSLLPWQEVTLNTNASGTIARLLVDLGDSVREGQVVAEIDAREPVLAVEQAEAGVRAARDSLARARAQVDAAQAQLQQVRESRRSLEAGLNRTRAALEEATANFQRMRSLADQALVAQRDVDVARTQFEAARAQHETMQVEIGQFPNRVRVAEAQLTSDQSAVRVGESELQRREVELALARKRLGDTTLRAPIAGAVARRHLNPGQHVAENTPVFTIVRSDVLKFAGTVAEHAALHVRPGQAVRVRVEPVPDRQFAGRVTRVSPAVDVASRTVPIEAEIPNAEGILKPGLFARGAIVMREDPTVAFVPEGAVSYFAGITRVFVIADGKASERTVSLGIRTDGLVEIVKGVQAGEQVATSGLGQLQDGVAVKVLPTTARESAPAPER